MIPLLYGEDAAAGEPSVVPSAGEVSDVGPVSVVGGVPSVVVAAGGSEGAFSGVPSAAGDGGGIEAGGVAGLAEDLLAESVILEPVFEPGFVVDRFLLVAGDGDSVGVFDFRLVVSDGAMDGSLRC